MDITIGAQDTCVQTEPSLPPVKRVNSCKSGPIQNLTPYEGYDLRGNIAENTLASLKHFLDAYTKHRPSSDMWVGLAALAETMAAMADGTCEAEVYLSSLDPGVGKTKTIIHFIQTLMLSPDHRDVGVMICVSRLEEINKLVEETGLGKQDYGVLTSNPDLNALGNVDLNQARVLFTTHQMVESRCDGGSFEVLEVFHFGGQSRQVRIWDEAILPGQPLTLQRDDLANLLQPIRRVYPDLAANIEDLFNEIKDMSDRERVSILDLESIHGVDLNGVLKLFSDAPQSHQKAVSTLWLLAGRSVTVRREHASGNTMLDYVDTLPHDLAPMVVLDASGRVRQTYALWESERGTLVRLPTAEKRYDNLNVHVWSRGGGKGSFERKGDVLVDGIVATINKKPNEEWLVVHHKTIHGLDLPVQVRDLIDGDKDRVHFIHWGNHHGTNDFAHVQNVILAGTLFYRPSLYEAFARLSSGISNEVSLPENHYDQIVAGEHANLILQALCRGSVRQCVGDVCAPCNAYIIASVNSGIKESLPGIFPGCKVKSWKPVKRVLRGKVKDAVTNLTTCMEATPDRLVPFKEVMGVVGMTDMGNFRRSIRRHEDFIEAIAELGIVEHGLRQRVTGFMNAAAFYGFLDETVSIVEDFI
jgi:hypothetical protein